MTILSVLVPVLMISCFLVSVKTDLAKREIPDILSIAIILLGIASAFLSSDPTLYAIYGSIFGALLYGLGYVCFKFDLVGGGDVKLWSASAFAFGTQAVDFIFYMTAFGVVLALIALPLQRIQAKKGIHILSDEQEMPKNILENLGCPELPYGLAIAAAGCFLSFKNIIGA